MEGSLFNHMMANSNNPQPSIGMGATRILYTDRHAGTIVSVNEKTLIWRRDAANRILSNEESFMNDSQSYEFASDPNGTEYIFTLRKNGRWVQKGESMYSGTKLSIGHRSEYYDFSF
jgi:hypothetical protein